MLEQPVYGNDETAKQHSLTVLRQPSRRGVNSVILRICLPALLWTFVGVAAPAFVHQMRQQDRAIQEDFAFYYFSALELRHGINPYTTDIDKRRARMALISTRSRILMSRLHFSHF
jgi:hypothetical protein